MRSRRRVVLLVQRHDDTREMYAEFLRYRGFSVLAATNADDAVRLAPQADVVLTGIRLTGHADGEELIARLRRESQTRSVLVLVLAAMAFPEDRARAEAAGCDAFLPLPCLPDDVLTEIRRLLLKRAGATASMRKPAIVQAQRRGSRRRVS